MNQPIPNSPQEAWLEVQEKGMVTFPKRWWDELGMQNGMFVKAKKEGQRVIIETQAVEEKPTLPIKQLKAEDQQIEELYQLRNAEEIWRFLEVRQYLVSLLIEAHSHIRKYFPIADLVLEYAPDPEIAGEEQLLVLIAFGQDVDQDHEALQRFNHDWWFDAGDQAFNDVCIMLG
jgi:bifunctional DNA-binding transcriptional regulator/antitoxin component of YhaV-PrlF toxin-antitoxin module